MSPPTKKEKEMKEKEEKDDGDRRIVTVRHYHVCARWPVSISGLPLLPQGWRVLKDAKAAGLNPALPWLMCNCGRLVCRDGLCE